MSLKDRADVFKAASVAAVSDASETTGTDR